MRLFTAHPNKFFSSSEMVSLVWGDGYSADSLKAYISRIKKNISRRAGAMCNRVSV